MSRGPGVWQRKILDALATHESVWLWTILPESPTRGQRFACRRAAQRLADQGRVELEQLRSGEVWLRRREKYTEVSHIDVVK